MTKAEIIIKEAIFWVCGRNCPTLQWTIMITEDIPRNPLIPLPSPWLAPTPDCHDSWTLTSDFQTAPMALLALTQKYHWAICSQSVWTKCCVIWVNKANGKTKHPCNGAPWRWVINLTVKGQTTTALHSRCAFSFPPSKRCRARVSNSCKQPWRWQEEGQIADRARLHTKHLSLLVMTPSLNTHKLLLLVGFHTHTLGYSTRVGHSVRSEGTRNKTLLCICQAVPTASPLPVILWPFKNWRWSSAWTGALHQRSCFKPSDTPKIRGERTNNKEVGLRVSPRGSEALSPHGALATDQTRQSARALISVFYVWKTSHLHSPVFSCPRALVNALWWQNRLEKHH